MVLVRAPAGFGKTTAMIQAHARLEEAGVDTAWLTLDRADNDASRFLASLAMATAHMTMYPGAPSAPLDTIALLALHTSPFVLFLDEFESIQESAVLNLMREIIDQLPRGSQIVIGSRSLPDLALGRLRARGQLVEIDTEHLRFTLAETSEFLRLRQQEPLQAEALVRLHGKTEGWVAALWLASITLARRGADSDFIDRFSGSNRAVAEYLAEDVLSHQPQEIREFLMRTSILRHLNPSLCQALNPHQNTDGILARLEAASLFLVPIATEAHSYRYHSLFSDYLRAQLALEQPEELIRLHLAASGWYESRGRPVPAIDHAIESGAHVHALTLLSARVHEFLEQGRMHLLARWFDAIPDALLSEHPLLRAASVWASCFTRGPWEAMTQLERSGCEQSTDPAVLANVYALRPLLLAMMDRYDDAYAAGRASLLHLPSCNPFADGVLTNAMAHILSTMGENAEAHRLIDMARRGTTDSAFNRMYSDSLEGVLDLQQGRLRQATARFRMAVSAGHSTSHNHTNGNAWAGVLFAEAMYEANQLDQTEHLLNVYLPLARDVGLPDHMISCHLMLARIAFTRGDIDQAFEQLIKLEYLGQHRQLPRVVASARLERSRLMLMQGNGNASRHELQRADDRAIWTRVRGHRQLAHDLDYIELAQLRWELHFGDAAATAPRVRAELDDARKLGLKPARAQIAGAAQPYPGPHGRLCGGGRGDGISAAASLPRRLCAPDSRRGPGGGAADPAGPCRRKGRPAPAKHPDLPGIPAASAQRDRPASQPGGIGQPGHARAAHAQGGPHAPAARRRLLQQRHGGKVVRLGQYGAYPLAQYQHETQCTEPHPGRGYRAPPAIDSLIRKPQVHAQR
jgi:LuxR family maltose regulon positive regulatory protein